MQVRLGAIFERPPALADLSGHRGAEELLPEESAAAEVRQRRRGEEVETAFR